MNKKARIGTVKRTTKETDIAVSLSLDGAGKTTIATGMGMADHLIELMHFWAGFDLTLSCVGDVHIDAHHSLEDIGLCLGQALREAVGDRKGIARVGHARVPMDEAAADVCLDLSGRSWLVFNGDELLPAVIAGEEKDVWREFFKSFASGAQMNLHITLLYGKNGHHLLEAASKALGLALRQAVNMERSLLLSTKGSLD